MPQAQEEVVPGYVLQDRIGEGGFGEVWKARGPGGVEVAVKIITLSDDQGFKEFFAIRLFRGLKHPNLVHLSGLWLRDHHGNVIGADSGSSGLLRKASEMVIAMGLGEKSLRDRFKECRLAGMEGIPADELLRYVQDAARALDYLNEPVHEFGAGPVGIQHCDIKPANLLIVSGAAQVCDFGVARVLGDKGKAAGGSFAPAYVAPEVIHDRACRQSDQYSLAITYCELRTGTLPLDTADVRAALEAHTTGRLDLSRLPEKERSVIRKATALEPKNRYPTCEEMVEELRAAWRAQKKTRELPPREVSPQREPGLQSPRSPVGLRGLVLGVLLLALAGVGAYVVWWAKNASDDSGTGGEGGGQHVQPHDTSPLGQEIDAAVALLKERKFKEAREKLNSLGTRAGVDDVRKPRLDVLVEIAKLGEQSAAREGRGSAPPAAGTELPTDALTESEVTALGPLLARLRVEPGVMRPPATQDGWQQRLADCNKATGWPGDWVEACWVECLAELGQSSGMDEALAALRKRNLSGSAATYALYAEARAAAAQGHADRAADLLARAVSTRGDPDVLGPPHRRLQRKAIVRAAVRALRQGATLDKPFRTKTDAGRVFTWLETVGPIGDLDTEHVLACWYRERPDKEAVRKRARELAAVWLTKHTGDSVDHYLVLLVQAEASRGSPECTDLYVQALDVGLRLKAGPEGSIPLRHLRERILEPATKDGGALLLGPAPDAKGKAALARLHARLAGALASDLAAWSRLPELGGSVLPRVVALYDSTLRLAEDREEQAEYLIFKGLYVNEQAGATSNDLEQCASVAAALGARHSSLPALHALVDVRRARAERDHADRARTLEKAATALESALPKQAKGESDKRLALLLDRNLGRVWRELAECVRSEEGRRKDLARAKDYAEKGLSNGNGDPEAWNVVAAVREDLAALQKDSLKQRDGFSEARQVYTKAVDPSGPWTARALLGRGRCSVRGAALRMEPAASNEDDCPEPPRLGEAEKAESQKLLRAAEDDLREVEARAKGTNEAAQAWLWRAKASLLLEKQAEAEAALRNALALVRSPELVGLKESLLNEAAQLALSQAYVAYRRGAEAAQEPLKTAEGLATELALLSKAGAAAIRVNTVALRAYLDGKAREKETGQKLLEVVSAGLKEPRSQDEPLRAYLLVQRAGWYFTGGYGVDKDHTQALADATRASELAVGSGADPRIAAPALGLQGMLLKRAGKAEALAKLRQAVKLSPRNASAWEWKLFLAAILVEKQSAEGPEAAENAEEACRNFQEGDEARGENRVDKLEDLRAELNEKAIPVLRKAIQASPNHPKAWRWHWRLAAWLKAKEPEQAKVHADKAVELAPDKCKKAMKDFRASLGK
jgi:hypothetical protein